LNRSFKTILFSAHSGLPSPHKLRKQKEVKYLKKRLLASFLPILFLLSGCFGDPVKDDLLNYVNKEMKTAYKLETKAITAYESVSGGNYKDDQTMYDALNNEVIPNYNEFIKELDSVTIETDELKKLHETYIKGAEIQYNAFLKIRQALEKQDPAMIQEANDMLSQARKHIRDYSNGLHKLAKDHDVKLSD
jgi:hypothetical protein